MSRGSVLRICPHCQRQNRIPLRHLANTGRCGQCKESLAPLARPMAVDEPLFDDILALAPVPVLVDFWASWCAPCKAVAPAVDAVAERLTGRALVLKVDTDAHLNLATRFAVRGIPYFAVFRAGALRWHQAGVLGPAELTQAVLEYETVDD